MCDRVVGILLGAATPHMACPGSFGCTRTMSDTCPYCIIWYEHRDTLFRRIQKKPPERAAAHRKRRRARPPDTTPTPRTARAYRAEPIPCVAATPCRDGRTAGSIMTEVTRGANEGCSLRHSLESACTYATIPAASLTKLPPEASAASPHNLPPQYQEQDQAVRPNIPGITTHNDLPPQDQRQDQALSPNRPTMSTHIVPPVTGSTRSQDNARRHTYQLCLLKQYGATNTSPRSKLLRYRGTCPRGELRHIRRLSDQNLWVRTMTTRTRVQNANADSMLPLVRAEETDNPEPHPPQHPITATQPPAIPSQEYVLLPQGQTFPPATDVAQYSEPIMSWRIGGRHSGQSDGR